MSVESVKMSDTEEKLCFKFNYPKKFLCCISLETGVFALALMSILSNIVHIGVASYFISRVADVTNFGELVDFGDLKGHKYLESLFEDVL